MKKHHEEFIHYATKHRNVERESLDNHLKAMTRSVIEERMQPFREIDVFSRLIMDRIIFLGTAIDSNIANIVTAQLLFLESLSPEKEITLYINSPGGSIYDGLAIYDTMQFIDPPVETTCIGLAASMAAVLLAGGTPNKRSALPHARIMIHQPLGGTQGQASEIEIYYKQMQEVKSDIFTILAKHTRKTPEEIKKDADRDYWMRPQEAKDYNLIDNILKKHKK